MNAGIDVPQIQRFGALYIASARLKSMSKWKTIIAAVDVGNPLFYLIAVGIGIGVLVEQGSGTSGTNGIKYIAFIAPALLANTAITGIMDETVFPTIESPIDWIILLHPRIQKTLPIGIDFQIFF